MKLKVLHIAAGLSSPEHPYHQPFIKSQINSLKKEGIDCGVYEIKSFNSKLEYFTSIRRIRNLLKQVHYDVVHAHYSYCGFTAYFAAKNKPIVLSLMGSDILGTPNFSGRLTTRGKIDKIISTHIAKRMDHIIVKSRNMKNRLKVNVPISVVPNGIDLDIFKPMDMYEARRKLRLNENHFIVLFLGNFNQPVKNFNLVKDSFNKFKNSSKHDNLVLLTPFGLNQQEVIDHMNASNVLMLTSFWEGSPNVVKEAMACNLPIIATDVGDVRDVLDDAENCFVVNFSVSEIVEKLDHIYKNNTKSNGRDKINQLRSDLVAKRLIKVYESVIY